MTPFLEKPSAKSRIDTVKRYYYPVAKLRQLRQAKKLEDLDLKWCQLAEPLREAIFVNSMHFEFIMEDCLPLTDIGPLVIARRIAKA